MTNVGLGSSRASVRARPGVHRSRLLDVLDDARLHRLVLVVGPPGVGKTSLLREWESSLPDASVAWVTASMHEGRELWPAVAAAVAVAWPDAGPLPPLRGGELDPDEVVDLVPDDGADRYLVIDDSHAVMEPSIRRALLQLVDRGPKRLHLVLGTRSDPEMPLHRMRVQGEVLEVRDGELRFDRAETQTCLERAGIDFLSEQQVDVLHHRCEGWPAGVRLAALSLKRAPDPSAFVREFAGTDRNIADYLIHEVLDHQTDDLYRFLLETSPFEELTPELCAAVTGIDDPGPLLERMVREHSFLVRVQDGVDRFRYHQLFRDLLRFVLRSRHREREQQILITGARWYEADGDVARAVDAWFEAGRSDHAIGVMTAYSDRLVDDDGRSELLDRWIDRTWQLGTSDDVWLVLGHAARLGWAWRLDEQAAVLDRADALLDSGDPPSGARMVAESLRGTAALSRCEIERARRDLAAAQLLQPPRESDGTPDLVASTAVRATLALATAELFRGRVATARALARRLLLAHPVEPVAALHQRAVAAMADHAEGRLRAAGRQVDRLTEDATTLGHGRSFERPFLVASLVRGWLALEDCRIDDATCHFEDHLRATPNPNGPLHLLASIGLAETAAASGEIELAGSRLDRIRRDRRRLDDEIARGWIDAAEVRLLVDRGDAGAARVLADGLPPLPTLDLTRAAVDLAEGRPDDAVRRFSDAAPDSPRRQLERSLVGYHAAALGGSPVPTAALADLVRLGEAEGFVWSVLRSGGGLVDDLLTRPDLCGSAWVQLLRDRAGTRPVPGVASGRAAGLIEPLSDRERDVMRYLPTRLSCREIAGELYVSVNTVKTHVQAIYRKLGCNSRPEAVERARSLRMLS